LELPTPSGRIGSFAIRKGAAPTNLAIVPLVPLVVALATGIVLDRYAEPLGTRSWVGLVLVLGSIAALRIRRSAFARAALFAAFVALGGGWHHYRWTDLAPDDLAQGATETPQPAWLRGVVRESLGKRLSEGFGSRRGDSPQVTTRFVLDLAGFNDGKEWHKASGRALVIVSGDRGDIQAGQPVQAAGHLARFAPPLNPGEFDYRAFMQAQGIRLRLAVDDPESFWPDNSRAKSPLRGWLGRIQRGSRAQVLDQFDLAVAPLAAALLLGQREGIEPEVNDAFARTGTTHLLAISGLQLQALAFGLLLLFRVVGVRRRPAYLVVGLSMVGYALLVGLAPSVVRSTVMTVVFCLAALFHRLDRPANTLALAALGTLAVNPVFLFDIGCQLSFLAIGTLIWLVPPACAWVRQVSGGLRSRLLGPPSPLDELERRLEPTWLSVPRRAGSAVLDGAVASTVVWLAALPLVALRFHLVSPIGILLNLPLIPLTSAALLVGGLGLALSVIWGPLGSPLAWAAGCLLKLTKAITLWGVAQSWGHRFVVGPALGWVLVFYALFSGTLVASSIANRRQRLSESPRPRPTNLWWLLAVWLVPGWLLAGITTSSTTLEAEFLAVGHGLAVLIQTPGGQTHLYDCGRLGDPSIGRRLIAPALWARGVSRIDKILLSHADQDHYGGLADLLDRFPIGAVQVPPGFATEANPGAMQLVEQIRSHHIPVQSITAPQSWETAGVRFTVLHPHSGWKPETSDNARSLVLDVAFGGRHLLLTGDLEKEGLDDLVAQTPPQPPPDVFLAPHHGGRSANPEWLYEWARPRLVVVSQRPAASTAADALSLLERRGISLLRTWRTGSIRLRWTSDGITSQGFLEASGAQSDQQNPAVEGPGPAQSRPTTSFDRMPPHHRFPGALRLGVGLFGFASGAIACLLMAIVEFGAWALVLPRRSFDSIDAPVNDVGECGRLGFVDRIAVRAPDGVRLTAHWFPAATPMITGRTVLLLHGFAESATHMATQRVATLTRLGWNVACLDSRGYGDSQGSYATFGGREATDVRIWLDALSERVARTGPGLPFQPVLWGRSMGALIALRAAALDRRPVALALESPLVDIRATTAHVLRKRRLPCSNLLAYLIVRRAGMLAGMPLDRPSAIETAARVECRTLIVQGTDDTLVDAAKARRLAAAFPSPPHWFDVPGAAHADVVEIGGDDLLARIAAALDQAASNESPASSQATRQA
jgi:competence protein ComEC